MYIFAVLVLLSTILIHASALSINVKAAINQADSLLRRDEPVGAACSPEGQWNCMPDTWQRCASGQWSEVMSLAEGTDCTPSGLTEEIDIEHDGSVNGEGGGQSGGGGNGFTGGSRRIIGGYLPLTALVVWVHCKGLF